MNHPMILGCIALALAVIVTLIGLPDGILIMFYSMATFGIFVGMLTSKKVENNG